MPGHNIDVNINFGTANASFQQLIDNTNKIQSSVNQLGTGIQDFANKTAGANAKGQKSITDYAGAYTTLTTDIKKNRAALLEELKVLEKLRAAKGVNIKDISEQITKTKQLESTIKQQVSTLNQYNKALGVTKVQAVQANGALGALSKGFGALASVLGISFGIYGAFTVIKGAIKAVTEFDLAQKKLQSILAENNEGMKEISASAITIGKNSIFGAKGVTELQIELAKMGFAKQEIIAMQGAINNLATATQEELAPSAEVVANIIRSFQLSASDATMVVDTMGKAFNDSALDLANFREAIKYVAPIAKQANFTFAETTSLLEQLSNAGIKGSLAGTGLTNIISRLGNENSKFVKTLGHTVNGFDEFLASLVELKNKGADLTDVFQLVDRRAAATFSILLDGVDTVEEFKKKLESSAGVMKEQTAVQLDSIAYRAKLVKESWKSMIIEMDKGNGLISSTSKALLTYTSRIMLWVGGIESGAEKQIIALEKLEKRMKAMGLFKTFFETTVAKGDALAAVSASRIGNKIQGAALLENAMGMGSMAESLMSGEIASKQAKIADDYVKLFVLQANTAIKKQSTVKGKDDSLFDIYNKSLIELNKNKEKYLKMGSSGVDAAAAEQLAIDKLALSYDNIKASYTNLITPDEESDKKAKKAIVDKVKYELEFLELQKKTAAEEIEIQYDSYYEKIKLSQNEFAFDLKIAEKKKELAIKSGDNVKQATEKYTLEVKLIERKHASELQTIWESVAKEADKISAKTSKSFIDAAKEREGATKDLFDVIKEQKEKMFAESDWSSENPIWSELGFTSDNDDFIKALGEGFDKAKEYVTGWANKWVEETERVVDARNNMVDEAEQALQTEIALATAGLASNVTLRKKDLADAKSAREEALEEARKARKVQAQIDTATQASSLITAVANIIKGWSDVPIVGSILGIAAAAAMLGSFIAFRGKANAAATTDKYETGGWVGGKRHSQGGTHIEAETGEYIVNRKSAAKHSKMIEAINNDDKITMNRLYINGLKNGILQTKVSLDDSQDLKAIRAALEKSSPSVTYYNGYRIEKKGNVTTRIQMN
jgi:TP901 family phage tail tape measure protein